MKRFYAMCGALLVGFLLVGPAHARPPHSSQRSGHQSSQRSGQRGRHHAGRHWRVLRPRLGLYPWQWLPEQPPGSAGSDPDAGDSDPNSGTIDPNAGGDDPNSGADDPNAGGDDPNSRGSQAGGDVGGGNAARPAVTPKGGSQRRLPKSGNSPPRISGSQSSGR
jgi:hypothetical protein